MNCRQLKFSVIVVSCVAFIAATTAWLYFGSEKTLSVPGRLRSASVDGVYLGQDLEEVRRTLGPEDEFEVSFLVAHYRPKSGRFSTVGFNDQLRVNAVSGNLLQVNAVSIRASEPEKGTAQMLENLLGKPLREPNLSIYRVGEEELILKRNSENRTFEFILRECTKAKTSGGAARAATRAATRVLLENFVY